MAAPRLVVVEGLPGAGKTSVALRLAEATGGRAVLEAVDDNPFLEDFRRDPSGFAFQTQVWFLLSRWRRQDDLRQTGLFEAGVVADCLLDRDRLYAAHVLPEGEWRLYEDLYRVLAPSAVRPDLVVYLQADPARLLETRPAHGEEAGIPFEALVRLASAFDRFFFHYDEAPLLVVRAGDLDPGDPADLASLRAAVETAGPGMTRFRRRPAG